jgi:hypothetical protein
MGVGCGNPLALADTSLLVDLDRFTGNLGFRTGVIYWLCAASAYALYVLSQAHQEPAQLLANFA